MCVGPQRYFAGVCSLHYRLWCHSISAMICHGGHARKQQDFEVQEMSVHFSESPFQYQIVTACAESILRNMSSLLRVHHFMLNMV